MPRESFTCPHCNTIFDYPAGIDYLADGTRLLKCPHCEGKFETLPEGGTPDHGVDPKGVV